MSAYPSKDGLSIYFKDVTNRKLWLEQLKRSNERFEKVTEATKDAIWDWNIIEDSMYWGTGYKILFGYEPTNKNPSMNSWENYIHPEDKQRVLGIIEQAFLDPAISSLQFEYRFLKADNTYAFVADRGVVIRNEEGKPIRMIGAMSDITPIMEYQSSLLVLNQQLENHARELAISNTELEQFAYVASHDLQEPLRMVSSFLTQLEKKYGDALDEKAHQYIHFAVDGAKRMRQIILDLLEFSRVGKSEGEKEIVDLNELIKEVIALHRKSIEEKNAHFSIATLPNIMAFKGPVLQVFHNIIGNAIKYAKEDIPPSIHITCRTIDNFIEVKVEDNGIGIEEEYFDKIFIIFQRLHAKEKYGGTGMGLSLVKKIMESMGGIVKVTSEPGQGATFYLLFPVWKINQ